MERRIAEERLRIARDMHDVLAHTVTAMSIQAAVASDAIDVDPAASARALQLLRRQGRQAVEDISVSIASLRSSTEQDQRPTEVVPGLAALDALVARAEVAGLRVTIERGDDVASVSELADVNAYRIVQEALTNIQKHSLATTATVALRAIDDELVVTITDQGPRRLPGRPAGFGLIGMRERAVGSGGSFSAQPTTSGGFQVVAALPQHAAVR